jgi:signal peptidase
MISRRQLTTGLKTTFTVLGITAAASLTWLQFSGGKMLSVQSGSMEPAIHQGSLVQVNRVPSHDIAVGDVITYVSADKTTTITHRVTALLEADPSGNKFVTKGDANSDADAPIETASVVGRVERSLPYAGYAVDFIKRPIGLVLLIYIPALLIIIHEARRLADYYRRIRPYVLEGYKPSLSKPNQRRPIFAPVLVAACMLGATSIASGRAMAAIQDGVTLTGNTISINAPEIEEPPTEEPELPPPSIVTCTNTNEVNLDNTVNQTAESGDAEVTGNTNGGSAVSGNASNSNSTSVDVNINNSCPVIP